MAECLNFFSLIVFGIFTTADVLEMEFSPLFVERYDLIIPEVFYNQ